MNQQNPLGYQAHSYNYKSRWISYFTQVDSILHLVPSSVLEVGVGDGIVCDYLRKRGLALTTLDVAPELKPDVVGSVKKLPFSESVFDVTLCAEVLEHIPYADFSTALTEIHRVTRVAAVVSLPHWGLTVHMLLRLPLLGRFEFFRKLPYPRRHADPGEHLWEIGKLGFPLRRIKHAMREAGFTIERDFIVPESPYHHFFILKKQ